MATADARDILGLANGPRAPAPKSKKAHVESGPRLKGMQREARALQGDSVPPIAITEAPRYKDRPNLPRLPARHWEQRPFVHGARDDGLVLRHWKRANIGPPPRPFTQINDEDIDMDGTIDSASQNGHYFPEEIHFEKYDVKVNIPTYNAEQYEEKLKDGDWTKEETDFLMELCGNFDLRWIVIADRYEPGDIPPTKQSTKPALEPEVMTVDDTEVAKKPGYRHRSMQELKKRYYTVASIMLETQIPKSNMTPAEFQLFEKMSNFDAKSESTRKELAEKLFERTKDEAEEERVLLEELKRITMNEEDFLKMRKDLYARLEPPPTKRSNGEEQSTAIYQTSGGLHALLQNLVAKEKRMKRPSVMPNGEDTPNSATDDGRNSQRWEKGRHPNQYSRRDTLDSNDGAAAGPLKKSSQSQPNTRRLTSTEEVKFGVSFPQERLTSGVAFRHEKATKVLQAKSSVQAQKISNALTELGIPARLAMPTETVCREFEKLVQSIHLLLDVRKGLERVAGEVKVLEEMKRIRLGLPKEEEEEGQDTNVDAMAVDGEARADADPEAEAEVDESIAEADKPDQTDDVEDESKVEQGDKNEGDEIEQEDEEDIEDAENGSDAEVEESDTEQPQASRKRRHEESPQVSDSEDEDDAGVNEDEDDEDGLNDLNVEEDDADSNADLGSQNDVSDEENREDDADEDEVNQEEDQDEDAEAEAEIEESEPPESARPGSAQSAVSRLKRSASVVSDASKAGSNRSGVGRKKRR